jgi:hypothetical protein
MKPLGGLNKLHNMIHSNVSQVVRARVDQLKQLQNPDQMLRTVALAVLPELKKRVHVEGKASDGSQIGTYSPGYMKLRTGNYSNAGRYSKGKNKGKNKNAGTFSQGINIGKPRPQYHRSSDPTVILSLTRQMENDESVMPAGSGYGIGFINSDNFKKSQYNEQTYKKDIWKLTQEERALAIKVAKDYLTDLFKTQ